MNINVLTVSQLNLYIKSTFDADKNLENVFLSGEISNFTDHYQSGHLYFSLKDDKCVIKAMMFSSFAKRIKFKPQNGMKVILRGRVSVYEPSGIYQIYVEDMQPEGLGALNLAFEQLKEKLSKEGLFDEQRKKPLPQYPQKIGVITSDTGAVFWDIQNILKRRFPLAEIVFRPTLVQGQLASGKIIDAINEFNKDSLCDVLIIARGGGSIEDLWAFNDEALARTIANSEIPIVSAVGHETDFTICDFVADLRAPTPSAAAELVVPDIKNLISYLEYNLSYISSMTLCKINDYKKNIDDLTKRGMFNSPQNILSGKKVVVDALSGSLKLSFKDSFYNNKEKFLFLASKLDALSPLKLMTAGYSVAVNNENKIVNSVNDVKINDNISLIVSDGKVLCEVKEIL